MCVCCVWIEEKSREEGRGGGTRDGRAEGDNKKNHNDARENIQITK